MELQDDAIEETSLARRPRQSRPLKAAVVLSQPSRKVTPLSGPAEIEVVVLSSAIADVPPVAAPAEAGTAAPAETDAVAPAGVGIVTPEGVPPVEPEATPETPIHPQDVDLGIPPQEVSSTYVRVPTFFNSQLCPSVEF